MVRKNKSQNNNNNKNKKTSNSKALVPYVPQAQNVKKKQVQKKSPVLPKFAAAQFDPFADIAVGVKVPDENTMPSVTNYNRSSTGLYSDPTYGTGAMLIRAHPVATFVPYLAAVNGTTWTAPATFGGYTNSSCYSNMSTAYDLFRTVAYGVKLSSRMSVNNASGMVHIAILSENFNSADTTWDFPTSLNAMLKSPYYRAIPLANLIDEPLFIQGRFQDYSAFQYRNVGWTPGSQQASNLVTSFGWANIAIAIEGAPVGLEAIRIETIHHFEGLLSYINGGLQSQTPAAPYSPMVMAATKNAVETRDPVKLTDGMDLADEPSFWNDCVKAYDAGLKVASGVYKVVAPLAAMLI